MNFILYTKQTSSQRYEEIVLESKDLCTDGKYDKSFVKLEKAIKLDEKRAFAYAIIGYCYLQQNKSAEAVLALTEAVRRYSREPLYFYRLGIAHCNLNNYNLAIPNLRRSIELNPGNPDFYKSLAECYLKAGNPQEAKKYLDLLDKLNLGNLTIYNRLWKMS